jgi:hypothetical protein
MSGTYASPSKSAAPRPEPQPEIANRVWRRSPGRPPTLRDRAQVAGFFDGFDILEPGIVPPDQWRPGPDTEAPERFWLWSGVGIKK